jgi:hypothetical protein
MQSKPRLIGYWIATSLFAAALLASGVAAPAAAPAVVAAMFSCLSRARPGLSAGHRTWKSESTSAQGAQGPLPTAAHA